MDAEIKTVRYGPSVTHYARDYDRPPRPLVSSVRIDFGPGHDVVHVWNRGGKAGTLTVDKGDGERVAALLLPLSERGAA